MDEGQFLVKLYNKRFNESELLQKNKIWQVLCRDFFQRFIRKTDVVVDIGVGRGEFINNICCKEKYGIDLNSESAACLAPDVKFFYGVSYGKSILADSSVDVAFMSNLSEHLTSKSQMLESFLEVNRILKPGGRFMILGPNIKYAYREYWDFFDHHIPLSHKAVIEILETIGFISDRVIPRFLPFTTKSRLPKNAFFVRLYLRLPFFWRIMGKQMLIIAQKP